MDHPKIKKALDRLSGLTTDVRNLYKPFVSFPVRRLRVMLRLGCTPQRDSGAEIGFHVDSPVGR
jgi:hypothetical protein